MIQLNKVEQEIDYRWYFEVEYKDHKIMITLSSIAGEMDIDDISIIETPDGNYMNIDADINHTLYDWAAKFLMDIEPNTKGLSDETYQKVIEIQLISKAKAKDIGWTEVDGVAKIKIQP